jgi:hypothetical protein
LQVELSRKAEGVISRGELSNLFPKLALGFHARDFQEKECMNWQNEKNNIFRKQNSDFRAVRIISYTYYYSVIDGCQN